MSTLISFIQWWSLIITWRESSLRLSGAVCPSWRRPWPWCCRRQWRRRWCRRRWPAQPCSAYFGNCPANKEIWWCGQKSKHRIIVIFTPMLQFPIPYLGFDYDKVSASGAFLVPKTDYYVYLCYTLQCNVRFDVTDLPHSSFEPLYPNIIRGSLKVDLMSNDWILLALVKNVFLHKKTQFENCQHHSSLHTSSELLEFQFKIGIEGRAQ